MKPRGIAFKLILLMVISIGLIAGVVIQHNSTQTRETLMRLAKENSQNLSRAALNKIESYLRGLEKIPQQVAFALENLPTRKPELLNLMRQVVENNPEVYGSAVAFQPFKFDPKQRYFAPYYYKKGSTLKFVNLGGKNYHYFDMEWYRVPKETGRPSWSEPFFDKGGGDIVMTTYSVPFYREVKRGREFQGVVTVDVSLAWLQDLVSEFKIADTGYLFLLSRKGTVLTHPDTSLIMNESVFSQAERNHDAELRRIGERMVKGESDFVRTRSVNQGIASWLFFAPLPLNGWSLGVVFPEKELMAPVNRTRLEAVLYTLGGLTALLVLVVLIARSITRPLVVLARAADQVARGDLDMNLPKIRAQDEVGQLAQSFVAMKQSLKRHIEELTRITAEKERMENELEFAKRVQKGFLPEKPPTHPGFLFAGSTHPARFVGGDFYDFIPLGLNRMGIVLGDVSGKGVSAALFMARVLSDFRYLAQISPKPAMVMKRLNRMLNERSREGMFATAVFILLDMESRRMWISNAGHFPLLLRRNSGEVVECGQATGPPLGILPDSDYPEEQVTLHPGDRVLLYTDGAVDTRDSQNQPFGKESLRSIFAEARTDPGELIHNLQRSIEAYASPSGPGDDLTFVCFQALAVGRPGMP